MKNLSLIILVGMTLIGCGAYQHGRDRGGAYGGGPSVQGYCKTPDECAKEAKRLATHIKTNSPDFEELYLAKGKLESTLQDFLQYGYVKDSSVRVLKMTRDNSKIKAIVSLTDKEGLPTTDHSSLDLQFQNTKQKGSSFPILTASTLIEDYPEKIHLGSVLDYSGSMSMYLDTLQQSAAQMFGSLPGIHGSVTKFSTNARAILKPTTNIQLIQSALRTPFDIGSTALFDGIKTGLEQLSKNSELNDAIKLQMVFTDGMDNTSKTSYKELKGLLREYQIPQIIIGMGEVDIQSSITLASDTDGLFFYVSDSNNIEKSTEYVSKIVKSLITVEIDISTDPTVQFTEILAKTKD